nr:MAG TPA: Transglycosylase SLT domain [Caudoviricetes sp.]
MPMMYYPPIKVKLFQLHLPPTDCLVGLTMLADPPKKTTAKIGELSKQYKDLMEQTKKDIFELEMTNALIQKHGFEPERASAIAKARSAKGSDLTKDDIALIDRHLSAQNKHAELTKKDEPSTTSAKKSTAPRVVGIVGDTGIGATHLDIRRADGKKPTQSDLDHFRAGGKKLTDYRMTSGYGHRNINVEGASKFHKGLDFAIAKGTEVTATVPVKDVKKWYDKKGGWVSEVMFEDDLVMKLLHQDPSMQKKVMGGSSGSSSSGTSKVKNEKKYNHTKDEIIALKRVQGLIYGNSGLADLARKHGVPAELLAGLMMQESKGLQYAKSPTGALGYFQTTSSYRQT